MIVVKEKVGNNYEIITKARAREALEADVAVQSDTYITSSPEILANLDNHAKKVTDGTPATDTDQVQFDSVHAAVMVCQGMCKLNPDFELWDGDTKILPKQPTPF